MNKGEPRLSVLRNVLSIFTLLFVLFLLYKLATYRYQFEVPEIPYSTFYGELQNDNIQAVTFIEDKLRVVFKEPILVGDKGSQKKISTAEVLLPFENKDTLVNELLAKGVEIRVKHRSSVWNSIWPILPFILIVVFWLALFRMMQQGPQSAISFGKARTREVQTKDKVRRVTFDDVAGIDEAKEELREVIEFLRDPTKFKRLGARIPKGIILVGPPGTGKTLLAKAVAGEANVPFFSISGSDFVELFVGVGAARVRDLFARAKRNAPAIVFIDELDAVGRYRGAGIGGGHDEREQTLNALLVEMDGFDPNEGIIVIGATNRPDILDPALLRPGRFDRKIVVNLPDVNGREAILKVHTRNVPLGEDVDLKKLAQGTPGFSGADLANMVNEAALIAAKKGKRQVNMEDFEEARDKVIMGPERRSLAMSPKEKRMIAYHEAGHALAALLLPEADPIHKVTIIPRGLALGTTQSLPTDDKHTFSKEYILSKIGTLLAGRVAEKLVLNTVTTGAANDLEMATQLARKMVTEWGMSEKLGPVTFGKKEEHIFLGKEIGRPRDHSERIAEIIDEEIRNIVHEQEQRIEKLLREHLPVLHKIAEKLLEKETLTGEEIRKILEEYRKQN